MLTISSAVIRCLTGGPKTTEPSNHGLKPPILGTFSLFKLTLPLFCYSNGKMTNTGENVQAEPFSAASLEQRGSGGAGGDQKTHKAGV